MNSPSYEQRIQQILKRYRKKLLKRYLEWGPDELRIRLDIEDDREWELIFDYLVFEEKAIHKVVKIQSDYIKEIFTEEGPEFVRSVLYLDPQKYDEIFEHVMEFIGISHGALFDYVRTHEDEFRKYIFNGQASTIREKLGLNSVKYNGVWEEILDLLLDCVNTHAYSYSTYQQGLKLFSQLYNTGRKHRSVKRYMNLGSRIVEEEVEE